MFPLSFSSCLSNRHCRPSNPFAPRRLLPPLLFSSIAYPMIGLRLGLLHWLQNLLVGNDVEPHFDGQRAPIASRWPPHIASCLPPRTQVLTLHNIAASSLSMALGAACPSVAGANMAGSLAVLLSSLLGGFLLSRSQMPLLVRALAGLSYVRWEDRALH